MISIPREAYHVVGPQPGHAHTHTLVLLHGRDSDAATFAEELLESETSPDAASGAPARTLPEALPGARWVFPEAHELPSQRFSQGLRQWFDMWSTEEPLERPELQLPGLLDSVAHVLAVVGSERERLAGGRIILGGISQGFATALTAFLVGGCRVDGLVGFASWMPFRDEILAATGASSSRESGEELDLRVIHQVFTRSSGDDEPLHGQVELGDSERSALLRTPVFLGHCEDDPVIALRVGEQLRDGLGTLGFNTVQWHCYADGGHWINEPSGIDDVVSFIDNLEQ